MLVPRLNWNWLLWQFLLVIGTFQVVAQVVIELQVTPETPVRYQNLYISWTVNALPPGSSPIDHFNLTVDSIEGSQQVRQNWVTTTLGPTATSYVWRVDCAVPKNGILEVTLQALSSSQLIVGEATVDTSYVQDNPVCYGPIAFFIGTSGDSVPALSTQTIVIQSTETITDVNVYLNGYVVCHQDVVQAGVQATCTVQVPCAAIGTSVGMSVSGLLPNCEPIPDSNPTIWTVTSVPCCVPRLEIIDDCGEFKCSVQTAKPFVFVFKIHPTDDFKLYENFNIYERVTNPDGFTLVLHSDCLRPTKHCMLAKTAYIIGEYVIPCYLNCMHKAVFKCLYTKRGTPFQDVYPCFPCLTKVLVTAATENLVVKNLFNNCCVVELLTPKVSARPCGPSPLVFDPCTGCWIWRTGDLVEFTIKTGCQPDTTVFNYRLEIVGCRCDSYLLFKQAEPFPPGPCGTHTLATWDIPLRLWGRKDLKAVLTFDYVACNGTVVSEKIVFKIPKIAL